MTAHGKPWRNPLRLQEEYVEKGRTQEEIADDFGCSAMTIRRWLKDFDIERDEEPPWQDEETLRKLYVREDMTQSEVAEELGCGQRTISEWVDRFGIEKDVDSADRSLPAAFFNYRDHETGAVYERAASASDHVSIHRLLAVAEFGLDAVRGMHVHHKNKIGWDNRPDNIEVLSPEEHASLHSLEKNPDGPWRDEEALRAAVKEAKPSELADRWGCTKPTIYYWIDKFDIQTWKGKKKTSPQ